MNKQIYDKVFLALKKRFIVSGLRFDFENHDSGGYDIKTMIKDDTLPPDNACFWWCYAYVYEKPWKVKGDIIEAKPYKLIFSNRSHIVNADEFIRGLISDYETTKQREKSAKEKYDKNTF